MAKKIIMALLVFCVTALGAFALCNVDIGKIFDDFKQQSQPEIKKNCSVSEGDRTVSLGMSAQEVSEIFHEPCETFMSEYGFVWNIYHDNFKNYIQIGIKDDTVVAMYTNSQNLSFKGLTFGATKDAVHSTLLLPIDGIVKGDTKYLANGSGGSANFEVYETDGAYITLFYDSHANNSLTSVNIIDYDVEQSFKRLYAEPNQELKESFEKQSFCITNAARAREGLVPYKSHAELDRVAFLHSEDMVKNNYFSHTNQNGENVLQRGLKGGVNFTAIGENLAFGAQNSIYLHELLMNSEGHRRNILADFTHLGAGVAFKEDGTPYLTQNFLK